MGVGDCGGREVAALTHIKGAMANAGVRQRCDPGLLRSDSTVVHEGHHEDGALDRATPSESPPSTWSKLGRYREYFGQ